MTVTRLTIAGLRAIGAGAERRLDDRLDALENAILGLVELLEENGIEIPAGVPQDKQEQVLGGESEIRRDGGEQL